MMTAMSVLCRRIYAGDIHRDGIHSWGTNEGARRRIPHCHRMLLGELCRAGPDEKWRSPSLAVFSSPHRRIPVNTTHQVHRRCCICRVHDEEARFSLGDSSLLPPQLPARSTVVTTNYSPATTGRFRYTMLFEVQFFRCRRDYYCPLYTIYWYHFSVDGRSNALFHDFQLCLFQTEYIK